MNGKKKGKKLTTKQRDEILSRFTDALNAHGKDSRQVRGLLGYYRSHRNLCRLMETVIIIQERLRLTNLRLIARPKRSK